MPRKFDALTVERCGKCGKKRELLCFSEVTRGKLRVRRWCKGCIAVRMRKKR